MILTYIKSKKKVLIYSFSVLLFLWTFFLLSFPFFLSKGLLCKQLNKQIKGKLLIQKTSLSWFKPQTFENITLLDPHGKIVLEIKSFTTSATLLSLLTDQKNLKETNISGLEGYVVASKDNSLNFMASLDSPVLVAEEKPLTKKSSIYIFKTPFRGQFHIEDSNLTIKSADRDPISFKDIQFNCRLSKPSEPLTAHLVCETTQNNLSGSMHLNLELGGFDDKGQIIFTPLDRDLFFLSPEGYLNLNAEITNLPSESLDYLTSLYNPKLNNLFSDAAGGPITCGGDFHLIKNKSKVNLSAHAKNLDLKFSGAVQQNQFFLTEPSTCRFNIKPLLVKNLVEAISPGSNLSISEEAEALIRVDRMTMPLDIQNFNFSNLSCNAQLSLSPMKLTGSEKVKNFEVKQIKGTVDTFDLNENVTLHFNALAYNNKSPVHFKLDGQLTKLIDNQKELKGIDQIKAHLILQTKDFPTAIVAHFAKEKELALEILGPSLNLDSTFNGSLSSADISMNLNSSRVQLPNLLFQLKDKNKLALSNTANVSFRVTPALITKVDISQCSLLQPIDLKGELTTCEFKKMGRKIALHNLDLNLEASPFNFIISNYKPCHIHEAFVQFTRNNSKELLTKLNTEISLPNDLPFYNLDKTITAYFEMDDLLTYLQNNPALVSTNLNSSNWNAEFNGYLDSKWNYNLIQEAKASIENFNYSFGSDQKISSPKTTLSILPTLITLDRFDLSKQKFAGSINLNEMHISKDAFTTHFNDIKIPFEFSGNGDFLNLALTSDKNKLQATLACKSIISNSALDLKNGSYKLYASLQGISPNIIGAITPLEYDFSSILGPKLNVELKSDFDKKKNLSANVQYNLSSSILKSSGSFVIDDHINLSNESLVVDYFISPASYVALSEMFNHSKADTLLLQEPISLKIKITNLSKALNSNNQALPLSLDGTIALDQFITNKGSLFDLNGSFTTSNILSNLKINLAAKSNNNQTKEGLINLSAELTNPISVQSKSIDTKINGFITCNLKHFPTAFLDDFLPLNAADEDFLLKLVGPSFNLNCKAELNSGKGPLEFDLSSDNLKTKFILNLDKDHLVLKDDLHAQIKLKTNEMRPWIEKINPLVSSLSLNDLLVEMTIPKRNFYIPLSPFKLNQIQVDLAKVSFDKLTLKKNDLYKKIFNFLKSPSDESILEAWFTPTYFSLKRGNLKLHRVDFLVNNEFHLAFWGDYNLKEKNGFYFLSVPNQTLIDLFAFKRLPENYSFQIPLSGSPSNLKADWATAAAQLGILTLSSSFGSSSDTIIQNPNSNIDSILDVFAKTQPGGFAPKPTSSFPWLKQNKQPTQNRKPLKKKEASQKEQTAILQNFFKELREVIRK